MVIFGAQITENSPDCSSLTNREMKRADLHPGSGTKTARTETTRKEENCNKLKFHVMFLKTDLA